MDTSPNTAAHSAPPSAGPSGPSWQDNLLDVLRARERMWFVAAILLILLGALLALLAPGTLPPTLLVGAAVGLAAVLLATALVVGLDASDLIVRGPRHVAAAGGVVAGHISRSTSDIEALVDLIDAHAAEGGRVRVALTPASRSAGVPGARANIVAAELAARGDKVLVTDLTRGGTPALGLSDVIAGDRKLADAVRFDDELYLAHLAVGSEPELALEGFADWAQGLPPDLDVLVAALPPLSEPGVLPAVQGVELVLLLVEVDRTERVDLIASLDAIDAAGVPAELVLVDATTAAVRDSASPTVEVLSTPGSAPRQQDPGGFGLEDRPGDAAGDTGAGVVTVPAPSGAPEPVHPAEPAADDWGGDDTEGMRTVPGADSPGDPSDPASTGDGGEPVIADRDDATDVLGDDVDDYELDDQPVMEPGGGHVRTMRRRGSATEDTVAMPPVGRDVDPEPAVPTPDDPADPPASSQRDEPEAVAPAWSESRDEEPAVPEPAPAEWPEAEPEGEPEPAPEPASQSAAAPEPEPEPASQSAAAPEPEPEPVSEPETAAPADVGDAAPAEAPDEAPDETPDGPDETGDEDDDPVDVVAREQARLSASLQQLADDVWSRGDD